MQFTTGQYSSTGNQHAEHRILVAVGLSWPAGTKQREAQQKIQQALQQAGLQVSIKAIFVPEIPGTKAAAWDTAIVSFSSREEAAAVRSCSTAVLLPVYTDSESGQLGLPVWLVHPGDPAMPASDSSDAAVHVSGEGLFGFNATQANMFMLLAWQSVYTTAVDAAEQQARNISDQDLEQIQHLQFYPANTLKVDDDTFRVTFSSPVAATSLIKMGSCRLSSGQVISFSSPNRVQLRGHQVMLTAAYVGAAASWCARCKQVRAGWAALAISSRNTAGEGAAGSQPGHEAAGSSSAACALKAHSSGASSSPARAGAHSSSSLAAG
jgi:hypothetical protein